MTAVDEALVAAPAAGPSSAGGARLTARRTARRLSTLVRRPTTVVASLILVVVVGAAVFAPVLAPFDPNEPNLARIARPPGGPNPLGTDTLGRDILSRLMFGARTSLVAATQAVLISVLVGCLFGLTAGYLGRWVDTVLNRVNAALMSVPPLILAIAMVAALGGGLTNAMIAIGLVYSTRMFRVSRAAAIEIRSQTYIDAARIIGCRPGRIVLSHVLPNAASPILVLVVLTFAASVVAEAGLTFISLGTKPPTSSWGSMLADASTRMDLPHLLYAPGITLLATVAALTVVGDAVRDSIGSRRREGSGG